MTPQQEFENLTSGKQFVNGRIREKIIALLVMRDRLQPDEEHLRDFIDLAIHHLKGQMETLNQEAAAAAIRLRNYSTL